MKKKIRELANTFPAEIDAAIEKEFAIKAETKYALLEGAYVTSFEATGTKKDEIDLFIKAYMIGHHDLSVKLLNL